MRKQKRNDQLSRRRNLSQSDDDTDDHLDVVDGPQKITPEIVAAFNTCDVDQQVMAVKKLVMDFGSNDDNVVLNTIRMVANLASWSESYAQLLIEAKALESFKILVTHPNADVQREATFTVSNITAGNTNQIKVVIDADLIPLIVEQLYMGDYATQCEASHVLLNISALGSDHQILYMLNMNKKIVNMDVIDAMASLMTAPDAAVLMTCLNFYNNVLVFAKRAAILTEIIERYELSSTLFHMESLQNHPNSQIAVLAAYILDEFFSSETSFEEVMATDLVGNDKPMDTYFSF